MPRKSSNKKKQPNDQGEIIKLLKKKEWNKVWEKLKYVGYSNEPSANRRYLVFKKACADFDPKKNNNFILFYKKYISYLDFDRDLTFVGTTNWNFIRDLKNENISPTDDVNPMVKQLKRINP